MIQTVLLKPFTRITPYGGMAAAGVIAGMLYIIVICTRDESKKFWDLVYVYVWAIMGGILGAKLLYILIDIRELSFALERGGDVLREYLLSVISGGFVFYGGLFGVTAGIVLSSRYFKLDTADILDTLIPCMPLFHTFGRIGCHIAGCCYGRNTGTDFGIIYDNSTFAPNGVRLYPVQLAEAVLNFLVFIYLVAVVIIHNRKNAAGEKSDGPGTRLFVFERYLLIYAVIRFVLEFFRGDEARGRFGVFSTSQWISILIVLTVSAWLVREGRIKANEGIRQD